jgi:hypothetical protein
MNHKATPRFWAFYRQLPEEVQRLADQNYLLLRADPRHPSLHFKKIGRLSAVRVGLHYRALAVEHDGDLLWIWIGKHEEYDRILKGQA